MVLPSISRKNLEELAFIDWYKELSAAHQPLSLFTDVDAQEAHDMICEFGYTATTYIPAASFYTVEDSEDDEETGLNISLKGGRLELMLSLEQYGKHRVTGSFAMICEKLGYKEKIPKPAFSNYKELYALLKEVFAMYERIKEKMATSTEKNTTMLSFVKE